jgi:hypothetical protein
MTEKLEISAEDLGLGSIDAQSQNIDWREAAGDDCEGWEIILPRLTFGDIAQHAENLLTKAQAKIAERDPYREATEDLADKFRETDSFYEWKDGFEPMMNYVWPAFIPYKMEAQDLADRLERYAPVMSLIYFGEHSPHCSEEYGYALTGGGMNLADQIAGAYLCAHQVPPYSLLESLAGVIGPSMLARIGEPLKAAYAKAAEWAEYRAKRLREELERVFEDAD